jgi:hypothetical protein
VATPRGKNSTSIRSFGEWTLLSGRAKPVRIVGMPLSASAGTIGRVPPERVRMGLIPKPRSNASCAILITGASAATSPGRVEPGSSSTSIVAPSGADSCRSRSTSGATAVGVWPGASRTVKFACASLITVVFLSPGLPPKMPLTSTEGSAVVRR